MDQYSFGRKNEELVASDLVAKGFKNVNLTPGSKGSFDVWGQYLDDSFILVQVKSSRTEVGEPVASQEDKSRLIEAAKENRASAYMAYVVGSRITYEELIGR